jgi:hypothetical protein
MIGSIPWVPRGREVAVQRVNLGRSLLLAAALEVLLAVVNAGITWISRGRQGFALWTLGVVGAVAIALIKTLVDAFGKAPEPALAGGVYGYDPRLGPAPYGQPGYLPPPDQRGGSGRTSLVAAILVLLVVAGGGGYALTLGFHQLFTSVAGLADPASAAKSETGTDRLKRSASAASGPLRLTGTEVEYTEHWTRIHVIADNRGPEALSLPVSMNCELSAVDGTTLGADPDVSEWPEEVPRDGKVSGDVLFEGHLPAAARTLSLAFAHVLSPSVTSNRVKGIS